MKKIILSLCLLCLVELIFSQENQPKNTSRFVNLQKKYSLTKDQVKWLDSLQNPHLSTTNIINQPTRKKVLIPDKLYISQDVIPIEAQILIDTFSGYNEVISYRFITTIISELDQPGSYKKYFDNLNTYKKQFAARLREQAANIEKE